MSQDEPDYNAWYCLKCGKETGMMGHPGGKCPKPDPERAERRFQKIKEREREGWRRR